MFNKVIEICKQIKNIEFFRNLHKLKLFWIWKNYVKLQRIKEIRAQLEPKIKIIYNSRLVEIQVLISEIKPRKFISTPKMIPISLSKYREYLEEGCIRALSVLENNSFKKIVNSAFEALE